MRIGVLTGGGDVPGLNPCIKALVYRATDEGHEVIGIRRGWWGLLNINPDDPVTCNDCSLRLDKINTRTIDRTGGTILHTSRTNPSQVLPKEVPAFLRGGNFDENAVLDQVYGEFGGLQPSPSMKRGGAPEFKSGMEVFQRDIAQNHVCLGFPGSTVLDPRRYVYDILSSALGGGSTSRLFERIREKEGLAYSIYSFHSCFFSTGMLGVYAAVAPESFANAADMTFEEIRKLRDQPMTDAELELNREHLKGSMLMSLENTFNRMSRMAKSMIYYKRLLGIHEVIQALDAVTVDDLHQVALETFLPDRCAVVVLGPASAAPVREIPL